MGWEQMKHKHIFAYCSDPKDIYTLKSIPCEGVVIMPMRYTNQKGDGGKRIEANIKKKQQKLRYYSKRGVEMKFGWTENEDYAKNHQHNGDEKHLVVYSRC